VGVRVLLAVEHVVVVREGVSVEDAQAVAEGVNVPVTVPDKEEVEQTEGE